MQRIAFIIGDVDSVHGLLQGVTADHVNYRSYLTSNAGGAWSDDEIVDLGKPSRHELSQALAIGGLSDYALVAFAGHGFCTRRSGDTYCCVNDRDEIPVWGLILARDGR